MESLTQAIARLISAGYLVNYRATAGQLLCGRCGERFDPTTVRVDEIVRFEGESDPADEAILHAVEAGCGHRGLYCAAYGSSAAGDDVEVLIALPKIRR